MNTLIVVSAALALAYWVVVGHGHTWVFTALALAAIKNDWQHARMPPGAR